MKRLMCLGFCLLFLLTVLPLAVSAEPPAVSATYAEGVLYLTWETADYTLINVNDSAGASYTPRTVAVDSAEVELPLTAGEHSLYACFTAADGTEERSAFIVTVEEPATPTFQVESVNWDEDTMSLEVLWSAGEGTVVKSVHIGDMTLAAENADGRIVLLIGDLPYGQHTLAYTVAFDGVEQFIEDNTHTITYIGGELETTITLSEQEGWAVVQITDSYERPVAGVTVHLEAGSTEMMLTTDEDGAVVFPALLSDVTYVFTDSLTVGDTVYLGSSVLLATSDSTTTTTETTEEQEVVATTASTRSTTRRRKTTTEPTTTTTTTVGLATHAGAGTTGAEEHFVTINVLTDEGILQLTTLDAADFEEGARLLLEGELYKELAANNKDTAVMLALLTSDKTYSVAQAKSLLDAEQVSYEKDSISTLTMDLGIIYWDIQAQTGFMETDLPQDGHYVIRLPRPANMEGCNNFYVVDMSGDVPGESIKANVDPDYIQFTLNGLGPVALVACEADMEHVRMYIHPVVYIFYVIGGLLLLLAAVMIYFFFIRKEPREEADPELAEDEEMLSASAEEDVPQESDDTDFEPEEGISLGDFLNKRSQDRDDF